MTRLIFKGSRFAFFGLAALAVFLSCASLAQAQNPKSTAKPAAPAGKPKPAATPAAPAQAPTPAPGVSGAEGAANDADPTKTPQHQLMGNWYIYWIGSQKATRMNIAQASTTGSITNFMGGFATLDKEACAISGTVLDRVLANYEEGPEVKTIGVDAYVIMRAQCAKQQIWIEAFGLPGGKVAMSGRATFIDSEGKRTYAPIAFGR